MNLGLGVWWRRRNHKASEGNTHGVHLSCDVGDYASYIPTDLSVVSAIFSELARDSLAHKCRQAQAKSWKSIRKQGR